MNDYEFRSTETILANMEYELTRIADALTKMVGDPDE
jgi:hypothetical protein